MKKHKNTLQRGSVRYIVFRENNEWYAAGLEFNIVESGSTPQEAILLLFEALSGYVESARKINARPYILNQKSDIEYEQMWQNIHNNKVGVDKKVYTSGEFNIRQALKKSLVPA
jgi:hypothetical protein